MEKKPINKNEKVLENHAIDDKSNPIKEGALKNFKDETKGIKLFLSIIYILKIQKYKYNSYFKSKK